MDPINALEESYEEKQHTAAYVFDPSGDLDDAIRPAKRRRVSKRPVKPERHGSGSTSVFQSLFRGAESGDTGKLRQQAFEQSWAVVESRIESILRESNQSTLQEVVSFMKNAPDATPEGKVPSGFIITGPNIASQDLLFEQLSEALHREADSPVVRLRSGDASNLRGALRKIISDIMSKDSTDGEDADLTVSKDGRKFLNYELDALYTHLKLTSKCHLVVIAFQDSEAFDSGLLSDLISLLRLWLDRIPFAFLFGVATSVELFEARLLKSTCQNLYADQFDVEQTASVVDKIFKAAVSHADTQILLGPNLASYFLERQSEQVASITDFIKSLKYAYMCHFYANPLSFLIPDGANTRALQPKHFETLRSLPSFRQMVETAIKVKNVDHVKKLLEDDGKLESYLQSSLRTRQQWLIRLLRIMKTLTASEVLPFGFADLFMDASCNGISLAGHYDFVLDAIKRMSSSHVQKYLGRLLDAMSHGDQSLGLKPWAHEEPEAFVLLKKLLHRIQGLQQEADGKGHVLRNTQSGQGKVLRTTVVAQKVQLSQDTATLTRQDEEYTYQTRRLVDYLEKSVCIKGAYDMPFHEIWLYDSKVPHRDVFDPRPRIVVERALSRPHDYLGCSCCKPGEDEIMPTLPSTAILYQLYLETGSLINAADLWSAYHGIVGGDDEDEAHERAMLVLFYRSMAEMKAMGFVKPSRKKADHVAKLAWRGL
ncbi:origin recognition complex subunit 3 N-terminus-domain-containing protein [Xylariaceae sp. FL0594]|nr:origin recognition complex subunit 3 N-terminus-domain-containing protein [Xylariaceae sp. FL0594]